MQLYAAGKKGEKMRNLIKKVIALLLVMGLCITSISVTNVEAEILTDRVLTREDIPDETLYNLMLEAGDSDGNGELMVGEASVISCLSISTAINDFKGLEYIERLQIMVTESYGNSLSINELELLTEKMIGYNNIYNLSINVDINEAVYENITKIPLVELSVSFEEGFDFSVISQSDISDKPLYESLSYFSIGYPYSVAYGSLSLEYLTSFSNLHNLQIQSDASITGMDKIGEFEFYSLTLYGSFSENTVIDLSSNTSLSYISIVGNIFGSRPTVTIGDNDIGMIILENVKFSDQPTNCGYLSLNFCDLQNMSMDFDEYKNLASLQISNSGISEISGLENCENLTTLNLSGNELSEVPVLNEAFNDTCTLSLENNNFTEEELLANAPECFSSNMVWLYKALSKKVTTPIGTTHYDVYDEFNSEYFQAMLDMYTDGDYVYIMWNTSCNELVIEKSVLEAAANKSSEVIFEFQYVDEIGNISAANVNLSEALEELDDDCVINFGFDTDDSMKEKWGTENVYVDLHKKYGDFTTYLDGVKYEIRDYLCNIYSASGELRFNSVYPYQVIQTIQLGGISESDTLYFIPTVLDTNSGVNSEEGVHSGKQQVDEANVHVNGIDYETVNGMADGSSISTNIAYEISDDVWNLIISKQMTLNLYVIDSTAVYVDGIITISYEDMRERESGYLSSLEAYIIRSGTEKFLYNYLDNVIGEVTAKIYVGDIAKNGDTVCMVSPYEYISVNKERAKGYEILNEYTVEAGMIEITCADYASIMLVNKNETATLQRLELPSGDIVPYKKGDLVVSTEGYVIDNVDLRGWKGGLTVSCEFEYCGDTLSGTFFALADRTKRNDESMGIVLDTDGTILYLTVFGGGESSQIQYPISELTLENGGSFDMSIYYIDGEQCLNLYYDDKLIGEMNVKTCKAISETENSSVIYYGTGVSEFSIADLNTVYNNEYIGVNQGYNFRNAKLSVYAGNLFGEDENSTDIPSDSDEGTAEDKDEVIVQPEQIEEEKIVEPEKAVEVLIEDISSKKDKTVDIVSSEAPVIDENVFESMVENDKNITFGVTDEENNLQYSWSFASDLIDKPEITVDLQIEVNKLNDKVDKKLNYNKKVYIEFKHHGELPGPATVKVYVGDQYKVNEKVQLYYYDEANDKILKVGNKPLVVKEGGYIEFTISHCSTYFALEEKEAIELNKEQNIEMDKDSFEDVSFDVIKVTEANPNTGVEFDSIRIWLFTLMGICLVVVFGITAISIKKENL